jgi:LysM repeat protein
MRDLKRSPYAIYVVLVPLLVGIGLAGYGWFSQRTVAPAATAVAVTPTPTAHPTFRPQFQAAPITPTPQPTRQPPPVPTTTYTVRAGDTLSGIAGAVGVPVDELLRLNGLTDPDQLLVGQVLQLPVTEPLSGSGVLLLPDSELVYGPGYAGFDVAAFTASYPGYFNQYTEELNGRTYTAAELVELVALQYSVGPRALLALLELRSGWLSNPDPAPEARLYPLGYHQEDWQGLAVQLNIAANQLNVGFYGWQRGTLWTLRLSDGQYIQLAPTLNAGTVGVQRALAWQTDTATWTRQVSAAGFLAVYRQLFGDPFAYAVEPLLPTNLHQPSFNLPWERGTTWYFTGGPHGGWGTGSAWAALDFVTDEQQIGCQVSTQWVAAAAPGQIIFSDDGMVLEDVDDDGFAGTGWVLLYLHVAARDRVPVGSWLRAGDRIGHPSCEGGVAEAAHLHFARRYNGVWIAAADPQIPLVLDGWQAGALGDEYDGTLTKNGEVKTACECWESSNALSRP